VPRTSLHLAPAAPRDDASIICASRAPARCLVSSRSHARSALGHVGARTPREWRALLLIAARGPGNEMGMHCGSNISSFTIIAWCAHGGRRSVGTPVGSHHAFFDPCSFAMASNSYLQSVYPMPIPTPAPRPAAAVRADGVPARAQRIDARNAVKRESTHACKAALCHGISHTPEQEFCEAVGQRAYGTESSRPAPPQARRTPACARCSLCTGPMSPRPAKRGGAIKKRGAEEK
jgi:hypothetical protein